MTRILAIQAASIALAVFMTAATVAGADALATRQYCAATAVALAQTQVVAQQTVVVTGRRST